MAYLIVFFFGYLIVFLCAFIPLKVLEIVLRKIGVATERIERLFLAVLLVATYPVHIFDDSDKIDWTFPAVAWMLNFQNIDWDKLGLLYPTSMSSNYSNWPDYTLGMFWKIAWIVFATYSIKKHLKNNPGTSKRM